MLHKKLLIITYSFPPTPGIGGRRWAKFAKYLDRNDIDIHILTVKNKSKQISEWNDDIKDITDKITYIPRKFPYVLSTIPKTFFEKLHYVLSLIYIKLFSSANYYDRTIMWRRQLRKYVGKKIEEGYNNILVNCAPFAHAYYVIELKEKYPEVNFVADFRDPWINNNTANYGLSAMNNKRFKQEYSRQKTVISKYDIITSVYDEVLDYFKSILIKENLTTSTKFVAIPNGLDKEDFSINDNVIKEDGKLKFIFGGTFYTKALHVFKEFCEDLLQLKTSYPNIYKELQFDFYGTIPDEFNYISKEVDIIKFYGQVSKDKIYEMISESDIPMLFLTDDMNYSLSTKFYEYIYHKKTIAIFSKKGDAGKYVEENGIGYACFMGDIYNSLLNIHTDWKNNQLRFNNKYDISKHDVESLTQEKIIPLLK